MRWTQQVLDEVRENISVPLPVIQEVRARRDLVRQAASTFQGAKRTFPSGSSTHWTAIGRILATEQGVDGDCGVVLGRGGKWWPLGPDGDDVGAAEVVGEVQSSIGETIRESYPKAKLWATTKRAIVVRFGQPIKDYEADDPSVDLIVALDRIGAPGLWIPNLAAGRWDASHPEKHNELLNGGTKTLRVTRARVVRLSKGWARCNGRPVSGFNLEALAWEAVEPGQGVATALLALFDHGATSLASELTKDPAEVSGSIRLPGSRDTAVKKMASARDAVQEALDNDDDEDAVRESLGRIFSNVMSRTEAKAYMARALADGNREVSVTRSGSLLVGSGGSLLKTTRSYGDDR